MRFLIYTVSFLITSILTPITVRSEIPTISILTCDSGDQLYSTFGHTGVRVRHDNTGYDVVYGYGTFDTSQSGFYLKFMRGKLLYYLNAVSYKRFMTEYKYDQRDVVEQVLNLDSLQAYQMIDFLENNIREENKYYKYDFFFDNCSTRIRDIFNREYGVKWHDAENIMTFRDQLDEKLVPMVWADFGIDLVIGAVADRQSNYKDQMFLPSYMMDLLDNSTIDGKPFIKEKNTLLAFSDAKAERWKVPFITPFKVFGLILFFTLILFFRKNNFAEKILKTQSIIWFFGMAICSVLIIFLWFFTDHLATKQNWNLLWINPLFMVGLVGFKQLKTKNLFSDIVLFGILIFSVISLLIWGFIPQRWHIAFLPMILINVIMVLGYLMRRKA